MTLQLPLGKATLQQLRHIARDKQTFELDAGARARVDASRKVVADILKKNEPVYGINTGFGELARVRIPHDKLHELQRNLILSHATGTGAMLGDKTTRLILALKIIGLARGYSGVRWQIIERLQNFLDFDLLPQIPAKGSVGASGDLAPLAHLACALIGVGRVKYRGYEMSARTAHERAGLEPLVLEAKEGLALINGTQVSTALALQGLWATENIFSAALVAGALTTDAILGSDTPFDPRIQAVRGHRGQIDAAAALRSLMAGSDIRHSHENCDRIQDPYSIRCQPQVMGACLDALRQAAATLEIEANAVSDNPLVFAAEGEILSGGNFHAEPVALAADHLALALAEIGALSERRIALLIDKHLSNLPAFLVENGGLNSGFMIAHVTAAALASENKSLAHPASVDSLPTSANQEDHVSMATFAARRLSDMHDNTCGIIGIELLAAAQGIEFRRPLKSSKLLEAELAAIRAQVPPYDKDRFFAPDIAAARTLVDSGRYRATVDGHIHFAVRHMSAPPVFHLTRGEAPILVSFPHSGTYIPPDIAEGMTSAALAVPDTDWHVPRLYEFLDKMRASRLEATHSRYVVDLNRPPNDEALYPGQKKTGLVPTDTFAGEPLYRAGQEPQDNEIPPRRSFWQPYHDALAAELARLKAIHGSVILWDAHSIASEVPSLFEGRLPDFNLGTFDNKSCDADIAAQVNAVAQHCGFTSVLNGRFKGGYITRHYGNPKKGVNAIQLEMAQTIYMDEAPPFTFRAERAARVTAAIKSLIKGALDAL